jgi:hypothetical protein
MRHGLRSNLDNHTLKRAPFQDQALTLDTGRIETSQYKEVMRHAIHVNFKKRSYQQLDTALPREWFVSPVHLGEVANASPGMVNNELLELLVIMMTRLLFLGLSSFLLHFLLNMSDIDLPLLLPLPFVRPQPPAVVAEAVTGVSNIDKLLANKAS